MFAEGPCRSGPPRSLGARAGGGGGRSGSRTRNATWSLGRALSCPSAPAQRAVVAPASRSRSGSEWSLVRERRRNMDMKCLFV